MHDYEIEPRMNSQIVFNNNNYITKNQQFNVEQIEDRSTLFN